MTQHTSVFTYTAASMLEPLYISLPGSQHCSYIAHSFHLFVHISCFPINIFLTFKTSSM